MKNDFDHKPTFIAYSEEPLTVVAGGGISGFGGVAVYKPQKDRPEQLSLYPDLEKGTLGISFPYNNTARIHVNGLRK